MSNQSSAEQTDVKFAAAILAVRATTARRCGGLVKTADWKEQIQSLVGKLKNPGVNLAESLQGDASGVSHAKDVGIEALRNAIIGAGVGGGAGLLSSLGSDRRRRQPWNRALRGALIGGAMGGLGTGAYRGLEYATSDAPTQAVEQELSQEAATDRQQTLSQAKGETAKQPSMGSLDAAAQDIEGVAAAASGEEPLADKLRDTGSVLLGSPESTTTGKPVGAIAGGAAGAAALPSLRALRSAASDRWNLGNALRDAANTKGVIGAPTPKELAPILGDKQTFRRRLKPIGKQYPGVSKPVAQQALSRFRGPKPVHKPGWLGTVLPIAAGTWLGGEADQAFARQLYGQPPAGPPQ
jgi:hypothetical protein